MDSIEIYETEDAQLDAILNRQVSKKDIKWSFGTLKIDESSKYIIQCSKDLLKTSLIVKDCTLSDGGEYIIEIRNRKCQAKLTVKGILRIPN